MLTKREFDFLVATRDRNAKPNGMCILTKAPTPELESLVKRGYFRIDEIWPVDTTYVVLAEAAELCVVLTEAGEAVVMVLEEVNSSSPAAIEAKLMEAA